MPDNELPEDSIALLSDPACLGVRARVTAIFNVRDQRERNGFGLRHLFESERADLALALEIGRYDVNTRARIVALLLEDPRG